MRESLRSIRIVAILVLLRCCGAIINGKSSHIAQFPFQAMILYFVGAPRPCGAVIIGTKWLVTTGKCLTTASGHRIDPGYLAVLAGFVDIQKSRQSDFYEVSRTIIHEKYEKFCIDKDKVDPANNYYDIGLIELSEEMVFSDTVNYIPLETNFKDLDHIMTCGWGVSERRSFEPHLQWQHHRGAFGDQCTPTCEKKLFSGFFCALHDDRKGACTGDSGTAAISVNYKLIGIAKHFYGEKCAGDDPDVYLYIPYFKDWIKKQIPSKELLF